MLHLTDFFILYAPLLREARDLLPMPAEVECYAPAADGLLWPLAAVQGKAEAVPIPAPAEGRARVAGHRLVIPLDLDQEEKIALVASGMDPALTKKISNSWLEELRARLSGALEKCRLAYMDPETGVYNSRAATAFLEEGPAGREGFFFLLNTVFYRRSAADNLQKLRAAADLLQVLTSGPCFSFGYGIFGLFLRRRDKEQALKAAHYLQQQLKREGMHKVQIASLQLSASSAGTQERPLDKAWQALAIAERRGPFGICDMDVRTTGCPVLFQMNEPKSAGLLHTRYKKHDCLTLAALCRETRAGKVPLSSSEEFSLPEPARLLAMDGGYAFILFPGLDTASAKPFIHTIREEWQARHEEEDRLSVGVAAWPCLDFSRSALAGNCLKALRHGSFLGPGSLVFFDHLSLNISGDAYFGEGDYRAAIREYRRGLQLRPGDVNLLNSLGVALAECGQERRAAECFQEALDHEPDNVMALVNLGYARQSQRRKAEALDCFKRAWRIAAEQGEEGGIGQELFLPLAKLHAEAGDFAKAITVLERWQKQPESGREFPLFRLLAQCYLETGQADKAIRAAQQALRIFPRDSTSLSILGLLYVEQGEGNDIGLDFCSRALSLDRFNPDQWYRLSRAQCHAGHFSEALEAARECLRFSRYHTEGLLQLGRVYQAMGQWRQAGQRFRRVLLMKGAHEQQRLRAQAALDLLPSSGR